MKIFKTALALLMVFSFNAISYAQNEDEESCKDYPMFNRMKGFHISSCENREFDAYSFPIENSTSSDCKMENVEGKYYEINYTLNEGAQELSPIQIFRNFENAIKQINGAKIIGIVVEKGNSYSFISAKVVKNGNETWIKVEASETEYHLYIVERQEMVQVIQANEMFDALNKDGFIALNILFDTGKATIKQESMEIVKQIYSLLNSNPTLKISIEGHTDNTGTLEENKTLSVARAKAIIDFLVSTGIDKSRLQSKGWGQEKPIGDNRTEEGRSKNRRVEIIKL